MASKKAILNAYARISANCSLAKRENPSDLAILLDTWQVVFEDLTDVQLAVGVRRFLTEVGEVNRSMVISAKLRELALPAQVPFNENEIVDVAKRLIGIGIYNLEAYKKQKALEDPLAVEIIENYGLDVIRNSDIGSLPTVYAQLRNDYKNRYWKQKTNKENKRLEDLTFRTEQSLKLLEAKVA